MAEVQPGPQGRGVVPGHRQGARAEVGGHHRPVGLQRQGDPEDAGAGADIAGVQHVEPAAQVQGGLQQQFGLGPGDQGGGTDLEPAPAELGPS